GQAVRINELAERMIRLSGLEPGIDIDIVYTGTRPGERQHEILFGSDEPTTETGIAGVMAARPAFASLEEVNLALGALREALARDGRAAVEAVLRRTIMDFRPPATETLPRTATPQAAVAEQG